MISSWERKELGENEARISEEIGFKRPTKPFKS